MPVIEPDFSEAAGLKPGQYIARIAGSEILTGKISGNPYIKWTLTTVDNEIPADNNQVVYHTTPHVGKGAAFFRRFVEAVTGEPLGEAIASFNTDDLHGRSVLVTLVEETGSDWLKVKAVARVGA